MKNPNSLDSFRRAARNANALKFRALARDAESRHGAIAVIQSLGWRWAGAMSGRRIAVDLLRWLISCVPAANRNSALDKARNAFMDASEIEAFRQLPTATRLPVCRLTDRSIYTGYFRTEDDARAHWERRKPATVLERIGILPDELFAAKILGTRVEILPVPGCRVHIATVTHLAA